MKIKLLALLLCIITAVLAVTSCSFILPGAGGEEENDEKNEDEKDEEGSEVKDLIYNKNTELSIILTSEPLPDTVLLKIMDGLGAVLDKYPAVNNETAEKATHEVVIGRTERQISKDAYTALLKKEASEGAYRFLIYSDGSSVAIAYEEDSENAAQLTALNYFIDNYINDSLTLPEGVAYRSEVDLMDFVDNADSEFLKEKWEAFEEKAGAEITASMKQLYGIFGDGIFEWFAGLYDPGVGGYYFSNSGRDGFDFLPDIESTAQALGFPTAAGMFMQTGETIKDFIPEKMQKEIIRFAKSLQYPGDGYFYHPQWGKAIASSRQTRDLGWATSVLKNFGSAPTYDAPNGDKGDGILWDGSAVTALRSVSGRLGGSVASAVSKAVAVNAVEERFESAEKFMVYVESRFGKDGNQPIEKYSYVAGNELSTLCNVINQRDKELTETGEPTIAPVLIEWLNERQNALGHWHYETDENGVLKTDAFGDYIPLTNYYANNGLLKIINVYNTLGYKMPRIAEATEVAVTSITSEEEVGAVVDVYNTWFCVNCIRRNLQNYGGAEGKAEYERLKVRLYELAPEAIIVTRDKLAIFLKIDGSFSQSPKASSSTSQNAPVAVPNTNEGDVNATRCVLQTFTDLYGALDLDDVFVPIYTHGDAIRYRDMLLDLKPFEKPTIEFVEPEVLDKSYLGTGLHKEDAISYTDTTVKKLAEAGLVGTNYPQYLIFDNSNADITATVNTVEGESVLTLKNYHFQRDPMFIFNVKDKTLWDKNDSYVIETDFLYEYGTRDEGGEVFQMFMLTDRSSASSIWYDGSISITHNMEEDIYLLNGCGVSNHRIELSKWYNMRIEVTDTRSGNANIKLYLNGELIGEKEAKTAARLIDAFALRHRFDVSNGRVFFDNTYVNSVNETGEVYVDPNNYIDLPEYVRGNGEATAPESFTEKNAADAKDDGIFGTVNTGLVESGFYGLYFDDDDPKGIQYVKGAEIDGDKAIEFGSVGNGDPYLTFINNTSSDSVVMELDFMIESLTVANGSGNYFVFYPSRKADSYSDISGSAVAINKNAYDEFYIQLGANTSVAKLELNTWYNIRLEMRNISSSPVYTLKVNGVTVAENNLSGSHTLSAIFARFAWGEKSGKVYIDNYYFGIIEN